MKDNVKLLHDSKTNKSTAFTREERDTLGLRGLLPYAVSNQQVQIGRIMENMGRKNNDIERYVFLSALQERNERLFYKTTMTYVEEILPIIYTPTVGQACKEFSHIFRQTKGFYITPEDKGQIKKLLGNWPEDDVRVIVVTDGQRILGLGDLGANGMGIPIGKLSLYSACGGIHPSQCLPVMFDCGTNNQELLDDPLYLGYPHKRLEGNAYFDLFDEFVQAVQEKYPKALIQFEDFLTPNAYTLLNKYRNQVLCFNDDIQGTAAVALAGVYASSRITHQKFKDLKIMFLGAGSAATGIADLMVNAFMAEGLTEKEAYQRLWFVDVNGLIVKSRTDLMDHNRPYAHDYAQVNFMQAVTEIMPNVLIGASGAPGTFTREIIEYMSAINSNPVIFALSNPTSKAECTAEQAYTWSRGTAVFASGSPFDNVNYKGKIFDPGQGNNAYIFPGLGLGASIAQAKSIPEEFFFTAAKALAEQVSEADIASGAVYPPLKNIRNVSIQIAVAVANKAWEMGLARVEKPVDVKAAIEAYVYDPTY
ncbi:MAG TPA: NAD-dependent malic enzyme [Flavobacteriales bacterium]|nr:NAD-dependent malic enzyme [Flavobacteriales bacterium]